MFTQPPSEHYFTVFIFFFFSPVSASNYLYVLVNRMDYI